MAYQRAQRCGGDAETPSIDTQVSHEKTRVDQDLGLQLGADSEIKFALTEDS